VSPSPSDHAAMADRAIAAGNLRAAADRLRAATAVDGSRGEWWIKLASVLRAGGDPHGALAALSSALALNPRDFLALLLRATLLDQLGDAEAGEAYGRALAQSPDQVPDPTLGRAIETARAKHAAYLDRREAAFATAMADAQAKASDDERAKFARFRSNVLRRTTVFHSDPATFHYPGLVEREFHPRGPFPWLDAFEAAAGTIRAEFEALLAAEHAELVPYVQYPDDIPVDQWRTLNHSRAWTAIHLLRRGERVSTNADHCPATMAAIAALPQPDVSGHSPNAMFSLLEPGAHIPPHTGVANTRLVCHLPLIVPDGCWFRVGAETRRWEPGRAFVFDDTIEHEAANEGCALRVVLIVDVWHPGLNPTERDAVAALTIAHGSESSGTL
jgi:hypothetical protein